MKSTLEVADNREHRSVQEPEATAAGGMSLVQLTRKESSDLSAIEHIVKAHVTPVLDEVVNLQKDILSQHQEILKIVKNYSEQKVATQEYYDEQMQNASRQYLTALKNHLTEFVGSPMRASLLPQMKTVSENIIKIGQEAERNQTISLSQSKAAASANVFHYAQGSTNTAESGAEEGTVTDVVRESVAHVLDNQTQQIIAKLQETRTLMFNGSRTLVNALTETSRQEIAMAGRAADSLNDVLVKQANRANNEIRNGIVRPMQSIENEVVSINDGLINVNEKLVNATRLANASKTGVTQSSDGI